jgi:hypothetical protein
MRNIHPLRTERRKLKRLQKLGSKNALCLWCGCNDPMLLRPVTRSFLEQHHPFGRDIDPTLTLALCFNCHALATEGLLQAGVTMTRESNPLKFAVNVARANEFHLKQLGQAMGRVANILERAEPEAKVSNSTWCPGIEGIIDFIFKEAWPIWKVHRGDVPQDALRNLDEDGDWPFGTAANAMARISRDEDLRFYLETGHRFVTKGQQP